LNLDIDALILETEEIRKRKSKKAVEDRIGKHLDYMHIKYFMQYVNLPEPKIGQYCFSDIENDFLQCMREYSINDTAVIEVYESPTLETLFTLNKINQSEYKDFINSINDILKQHTDENLEIITRRKSLINQLRLYISDYSDEDEYQKIINFLYHEDHHKIYQYIDKILDALHNAEVHQILKIIDLEKPNSSVEYKYIAIEVIFQRKDFLLKLNSFDKKLKQMKKDRKKIWNKYGPDSILLKRRIKKDISQILSSSEEDYFKLIDLQTYIFYMMYGAHKIDIYLIHSILGYKYKNAVDLYKKIFLKGSRTGSNDNFLLHTYIFDIKLNIIDSEIEFDALIDTIVYHIISS